MKHYTNSQQTQFSGIAKLLLFLTVFAPVLSTLAVSYFIMQEARKIRRDVAHIKKCYEYQQHNLEKLQLQQELDRNEDVHQWKRIILLEYEVLEPEAKLRTLNNHRQ